MTTRPLAGGNGRSRLDPEPIPRRDFLGRLAVFSSFASLAFALAGIMRLPKAAVLPSPSKKFSVKLPEAMQPGVPFVPPGRSVAIFRDEGGVYAVSTVCTHLGCIVKADAGGFKCPCHGSEFRRDGTVVRGPAPKPLPWLALAVSAGSVCTIDEGSVVESGRRARG